jgi:hypothetical protein
MRCDDVIRELSVPTGAVDHTTLAEHVSGCARCAAWAEGGAKLERLWEATRPPELSDAAWGRIWENVSASIDRPKEPEPKVVAPSRRAAFAVFALAQAAAILAMVVYMPRSSSRAKVTEIAASQAEPKIIEIDQDTVPVITFEKGGVHVRDVVLNDNANTVDEFFVGLNKMESIAALQ